MTHKHIISVFVLMSVILPTTSFAETMSIKNTDKKDSPKVEARANVPAIIVSEKEKDRNRKQRIGFALNAVDQNISIVEKSIKQVTLRLDGVDQNSPKIAIIKSDLSVAGEKLVEAKKIISDIRINLKTISTSNAEQIKEVLAKIEVAKKDIFESIKITKKAVQTLKGMKVIKQNGTQTTVTTTKVK